MMEAVKLHKPWLIGIAKVLTTIGVVLAIHYFAFGVPIELNWRTAIAIPEAILYLHLFKYLWHRFVMHKRVKFLESVKESHNTHHTDLCGEHFRTRDPRRLNNIVSDIHIFPILVLAHYFASLFILPWDQIPIFFITLSAWFAFFEMTHWLTHVDDTNFDRWSRKTRIWGYFWLHMVEFHREHHKRPDADFNFLYPYVWDAICGTYRGVKIEWNKDLKMWARTD